VVTEQIEMFQGYIAEHPQHSEYYESIIIHLNSIHDMLKDRLDQILLEQAECNTQN